HAAGATCGDPGRTCRDRRDQFETSCASRMVVVLDGGRGHRILYSARADPEVFQEGEAPSEPRRTRCGSDGASPSWKPRLSTAPNVIESAIRLNLGRSFSRRA